MKTKTVAIWLTLIQVLLALSAYINYLQSGSKFAAFALGLMSGIALMSIIRLARNRE